MPPPAMAEPSDNENAQEGCKVDCEQTLRLDQEALPDQGFHILHVYLKRKGVTNNESFYRLF